MDLKRRGLEMGGLLAVLLLRSCLLSAVHGTLTFCSQHGSLGNNDCGATRMKNDKNIVVNVLCSVCVWLLHPSLLFPTLRRSAKLAVIPCLKVEVFMSQGYSNTVVALESIGTLRWCARHTAGQTQCN